MESNSTDINKMETNEVEYGRGKNKHFWTEEESWALVRCLQDMATDPLWKTDGGFKNNYMNEIKRMLLQKLPNFAKEVKHIDSRIKFFKAKFHAITEMCKQSGCTWNDVEKKIVCERSWYDDWVKGHKDAKSLYNTAFPYMTDLEIVYGKDRATGIVAEDPVMAAHNMANIDIDLSITDDSDNGNNEVEVNSMSDTLLGSSSSARSSSNKRKSVTDKLSKISKKSKVGEDVQNVDLDLKELNAEVRGFMKNIGSHFESMSNWMQGGSGKMPQVLEELSKHGFTGKEKYKAAKAICQDIMNVELLFSLDPREVKEFVLTFL